MATQIQRRPAQPDSRPIPTASKHDDRNAKRIPQDPIPVPQQRVRPAARATTATTKYPAGYFFG